MSSKNAFMAKLSDEAARIERKWPAWMREARDEARRTEEYLLEYDREACSNAGSKREITR
jgi:hypothetical protein